MTRIDPDSEQALEHATLKLFQQRGWDTVDCYDEVFGAGGDVALQRLYTPGRPNLGRETSGEVVLVSRMKAALQKLNPELPDDAIEKATTELTRDRSAMSLVNANREVYKLIRDGVKVTTPSLVLPRDGETHRRGEDTVIVTVIDWDEPHRNDFLIASQMWITGNTYTRRADLIGFVNGLPLLFIELKTAHCQLKDAFDGNLRDYTEQSIPQLFWYNACIILSNGTRSVIGSLTADWEHFAEWKKINREGEEGVISLDTLIRGTCQTDRLLDLTENFVLYEVAKGGVKKHLAKYHQYFGVNSAIAAVQEIRSNQGRLGVFWHTQGSGKSYSMVFFSQKVLRKQPGNWTFVVITDRDDLDDQIYKNFANTNVLTEAEQQVRANSGEHLKQLLHEDHRYVFALIQKFRIGTDVAMQRLHEYPKLSDRSDIIVMADEAHRSQYDTLALNMRNGLPHAAYIAFTGTPLIAGEERTREVFGDYVSIYNFKQSVDDHATVPLYYENRIPELQLINPDLNEQLSDVIDRADLDEAQQAALEQEFHHEYHLITRDDRLEKIAADLVTHFLGRGYRGKAMVVSIDKATAVRMFEKVQKYWKIQLATLIAELETAEPDRRSALQEQLDYIRSTDMAVVVSQSQNEVADILTKGGDIRPHRQRMNAEDLETKFKDAADPFRIVFVCAMWMTGFDAPACSTIYLDKPMRNHTLMQTIARANRVFGEKNNGLIVDYIGVFRNLQKALAIYGSASGGNLAEVDTPVKEKAWLVDQLRKAITEVTTFCNELKIDLKAIMQAEGFDRIRLRDDTINALLVNDETKQKYLAQAAVVDRLFKAILPDVSANEFSAIRKLIVVLAEEIRAQGDPVDIADVVKEIDAVLDDSVAAGGYVIQKRTGPIDLSQIDFDALQKHFAKARKNIEVAQLRGMIERKLEQMIRENHTRLNFYEQFQRMIEEYNAGAKNIDALFAELVSLARQLNEEEQRGIKENLNAEELAIFDLLTRPDPTKLTKKEREAIKHIAQDLLHTLKAERLVLEWRSKQQARAAVQLAIQVALEKLPPKYDDRLYQQKCGVVYQHVYDSYYGSGSSVYAVAG